MLELNVLGLAVCTREAIADMRARGDDELPRPGSMTLDEIERAMIVNCMRHYGGNVTRVADALGLSRAALYRRLEKYGLQAG